MRGSWRFLVWCLGAGSRIATCTALLAAGPAAAAAETITLLADPWCPYNCEPGSDRPGFMVEIAREAFALAGHDLDYQALNWMRSLYRVRQGEAHGVIGAIPAEAPDFIFGPPLGTYLDTVAVRRGETLDLASPNPLEGKVVGAINGYEYVGSVADYVREHGDDRSKVQFVSGNDPLAQNLEKLLTGRVDVVAEVELVLLHKIAEQGMAGRVEVMRAEEPEEIFIAFSPALEAPPRLVRDLETGLAVLRRSGRLEQIMARYGLEVWD